MSCPRAQGSAPAGTQTQTPWSRVQHTNHKSTATPTENNCIRVCCCSFTSWMVKINTLILFFFPEVFPPSILQFKNQSVYRRTIVTLYCNISANPAPSVKWYKGSQSLEGKIEELNRFLSCGSLVQDFYRVKGEAGELVICKPENALHTGFYTCIAANRRGKSNATAFLDVLGKFVFMYNYKQQVVVHLFIQFARPPVRPSGWPVCWSVVCSIGRSFVRLFSPSVHPSISQSVSQSVSLR